MKGETFFAFLGGLLVGAGAALLFAPESGEETRKKIKNTFDKEFNTLKEKINNMASKAENRASAPSGAPAAGTAPQE